MIHTCTHNVARYIYIYLKVSILFHTLGYLCILFHILRYLCILFRTLGYLCILFHTLGYLCILQAHVYSEDGVNWDAMLNQTNVKNNNNKFYILQLLKDDTVSRYSTWFRWGRGEPRTYGHTSRATDVWSYLTSRGRMPRTYGHTSRAADVWSYLTSPSHGRMVIPHEPRTYMVIHHEPRTYGHT